MTRADLSRLFLGGIMLSLAGLLEGAVGSRAEPRELERRLIHKAVLN